MKIDLQVNSMTIRTMVKSKVLEKRPLKSEKSVQSLPFYASFQVGEMSGFLCVYNVG